MYRNFQGILDHFYCKKEVNIKVLGLLYNLNLVSVTSRQQNFLLHNYEAKRRNYARKRGYSFKLFHIHKHKNKTFQPQAVNFKAESELCGKLIGTSSIIHALQSCCYFVEI